MVVGGLGIRISEVVVVLVVIYVVVIACSSPRKCTSFITYFLTSGFSSYTRISIKKTLVLPNTFTQVVYEVPFLHFASSIIWMKVQFSRRKGDLLPLGWKVALR